MSTFGRVYRVTTFGESHSAGGERVIKMLFVNICHALKGVGCTIEGFPSGLNISIVI